MPAIYELDEWHTALKLFAKPLAVTQAKTTLDADKQLTSKIYEMQAWNEKTYNYLCDISTRKLWDRFNRIGEAVSIGIKLRQGLDTDSIDTALAAKGLNPEIKQSFFLARTALKQRLEVLADIAVEAIITADMALPSQKGDLRALLINIGKFSRLLGGRRIGFIYTGLFGTCIGASAIFFRERKHVLFAIGHQIRKIDFLRRRRNNHVKRINKYAGTRLLDFSRGELLRSLYKLFDGYGIARPEADKTVLAILRGAVNSSTKPWKALVIARDMIRHTQVDPTNDDFAEQVHSRLRDDITYTHAPGSEWVVREYQLARQLLAADSKISRNSESIVLSQAGASIAPGALGSNKALLRLAAHYLTPVKIYSDSIVSQTGADHRRHRKVFQHYFKRSEVLKKSAFIELTAQRLAQEAKNQGTKNANSFDFKNDLVNRFPIKIICAFLGIPGKDAEKVQTWSVDLVRSLDAGAGLSLDVLKKGNQAARDYYDYLHSRINEARNGKPVQGILGEVARGSDQTDDELLANLVTLTFAGFETTTGLLTMGMYELLTRREQFELLQSVLVPDPTQQFTSKRSDLTVKANDFRWMVWAHYERDGKVNESDELRYNRYVRCLEEEPEFCTRLDAFNVQEEALKNAVEEMLRWTTPGSVIPLTVEADYSVDIPNSLTLNGCPATKGHSISFAKGQTIRVELGPSNMRGCPVQPGAFENRADRFDISRQGNTKHISFGVSHFCIGADLAVENAKRMLETCLRLFPNLRLNGLPNESDGQLFFTYDTLPVQF